MEMEPNSELPEIEIKLNELLERVIEINHQLGDDPLEQALAMQRMKKRLLEAGMPAEDFPKFSTLKDVKAVVEATLEQVSLLKQVNLFNRKYRGFFNEEPTPEQLAEYVQDSRWMLPIFIKVFGEDSKEVKQMRMVAGVEL